MVIAIDSVIHMVMVVIIVITSAIHMVMVTVRVVVRTMVMVMVEKLRWDSAASNSN